MTEGDAFSISPIVSSNGRFIVYLSWASNVWSYPSTSNPATGNFPYVILYDRDTKRNELISVDLNGNAVGNCKFVDYLLYSDPQRCDLSADGRYVTFSSKSTNVPEENVRGVFVRDRIKQKTELVSWTSEGQPFEGSPPHDPMISDDGKIVVFMSYESGLVPNDPHPRISGDSSSGLDAFIHNRETGETRIVPLQHYDSPERRVGAIRAVIDPSGRYIVLKGPI